ncbi:hypothetical protein [Marinobacterium marinum]|uniref:DUF306 domain-containing protein n=1 Tax=Marinobacterium marinum TaxID=2756129 RepID=A0A7W1WXU0_9GAMM|nr:hypothetical protein [Marinobacterium marinum]MBA4502202.1 hypothetical protein [Marinobacterium marinum]
MSLFNYQNRCNKTVNTLLAGLLASVCSASVQAAAIDETMLYGNWACSHEENDEGTHISAIFDVSYNANGTIRSLGNLKVTVGGMVAMANQYDLQGEWEIKDGYLLETTTHVQGTNLTNNSKLGAAELADMFPADDADRSLIVELSDQKLITQGEDGVNFECSRKR